MNSSENAQFALGLFYLIIIFVTYSFQYGKIIKNKNVIGISQHYLILGNLCSGTSLVNTLIFYHKVMRDCSVTIECVTKMIGFYQIVSQFLCFNIFYIMYLYYYRDSEERRCSKTKNLYYALSSLLIIISLSIAIGLLSINNWNGSEIPGVIYYGRFLGIASTIFVFIQYLPQIHKIYHTKSSGALSSITVILIGTGNFVSFGYLLWQGTSDVTTWFPYLTCFILQFIMAFMMVYYDNIPNELTVPLIN